MRLLTTYFKRELQKRGYPTDDIGYSLSYCQGDGVAWYGDIDTEELVSLANRLLSGNEKAAAKRAIEKGCSVSISRNSFGYHYSHFNTMDVVAEDYYADELTEFEASSLNALETAIQDDVRDVSHSLECDGYRIYEAGNEGWGLSNRQRSYSTDKFVVRISEVEDRDFDMDDWFDELSNDVYADFVSGKARYFTLEVKVENTDGVELGASYLGGCLAYNNDKDRFYGGYLRQKVSEAISEARTFIQSVSLAA